MESSTAVAFGLDLAWSERHLSGICAVSGDGRMVDEALVGSDDDIMAWVLERLPAGGAVVAVDAPLLVPNQTGRRPCEHELSLVYGGRKASAHPANRVLLTGTHGRIRGEELAGRLAGLGFGGPWSGGDRTLLEVYPHPGLIEVFGLAERLRYKRKRGFGVTDQRAGLNELGRLLGSLSAADPPLHAPALVVDDTVRGAMLKATEDRLDARFCAWMALLWSVRGPTAFRIFGDADTGHIVVPSPRVTSSA